MQLKVSASLLNSWKYLWECPESFQEKVYEGFVNSLKRIKTPPTEAMQRGIDFEKLCDNGDVPIISGIIKGGQFQYYAEKIYKIDNQEFKLVGYLDCLKEGEIFDIKRNTRYEYGKYRTSYQHWCYFALVPEAFKFTYLIGSGYSKNPYDESVEIHQESYENNGTADYKVISAVKQFVAWLKTMDLYDLYVKNFEIKENEK